MWEDYEEALRDAWDILMDPEEIIFRIAQATGGMSGRSPEKSSHAGGQRGDEE